MRFDKLQALGYRFVNIVMTAEKLIDAGTACREHNNPEGALSYYAQALVQDRGSASAFNNYGNVLREIGEPEAAIPFLQRAIQLAPGAATPNFNLAVAYLLSGDYARGWPQYESRWSFEHLDGTLPKFTQPRWTGQDLKDRTILVVGEQGLGDVIQFSRFLAPLHASGARVILQTNPNLAALFQQHPAVHALIDHTNTADNFDYWSPIMSLPGVMGVTLANLPQDLSYLSAVPDLVRTWAQRLGPKTRMRVGICWSGRPDSWINRHKSMPFEIVQDLIARNPDYEWINLQVEADADTTAGLAQVGVSQYPGTIRNFADTAALLHHMDVVISVDTAVAHLSGALGRATWIPLNWYGVDWRWLLARDNTPWYPTARLFRQPTMGDWATVIGRIEQHLTWFKI